MLLRSNEKAIFIAKIRNNCINFARRKDYI